MLVQKWVRDDNYYNAQGVFDNIGNPGAQTRNGIEAMHGLLASYNTIDGLDYNEYHKGWNRNQQRIGISLHVFDPPADVRAGNLLA